MTQLSATGIRRYFSTLTPSDSAAVSSSRTACTRWPARLLVNTMTSARLAASRPSGIQKYIELPVSNCIRQKESSGGSAG